MSVVTFTEAQEYLPAIGLSDEPKVQLLLDAAEDLVASYIGSPLAPTETVETLPAGTTVLRYPLVVSLTSVTQGDTALTGLTVSDAGILRGSPWYGDVTVTYVAGFATLPAAVRLAVLYTLRHAWESEQGSVPVPYQSGADENYITASGFALPNRAKELLAPYRMTAGVA